MQPSYIQNSFFSTLTIEANWIEYSTGCTKSAKFEATIDTLYNILMTDHKSTKFDQRIFSKRENKKVELKPTQPFN